MADRPGGSSFAAIPRPADRARSGGASTDHSLLRPAHARTNDYSTQLLVYLALAVTLAALMVLAGATLTVALVALIVLSSLLLLTSPLWAPVTAAVFFAVAASFFACPLALAALGVGTWAYRYLTGRHPVGAHRRGQYADAATHSYVWGKDEAPLPPWA